MLTPAQFASFLEAMDMMHNAYATDQLGAVQAPRIADVPDHGTIILFGQIDPHVDCPDDCEQEHVRYSGINDEGMFATPTTSNTAHEFMLVLTGMPDEALWANAREASPDELVVSA